MNDATELAFVRREIAPEEPPPTGAGLPSMLRQRLFGSVPNTILTALGAALLIALVWPTFRFLLWDAVWSGSSRNDCLEENVGRPVGACWPFIAARFNQLMYGFYVASEQWRVNVTYMLGAALV